MTDTKETIQNLAAQINANEVHALFSKGSRKARLLYANKKMLAEIFEMTQPETETPEMTDSELLAQLGL